MWSVLAKNTVTLVSFYRFNDNIVEPELILAKLLHCLYFLHTINRVNLTMMLLHYIHRDIRTGSMGIQPSMAIVSSTSNTSKRFSRKIYQQTKS